MTSPRVAPASDLDVARIRADFPILRQQVKGKPLVYLDNAASAQKPAVVLDEIRRFDAEDYSNIHRGVHELSERATDAFEAARGKSARLLGAEPREIVFVRGTTEALNLVASSYGKRLEPGDEVVLTWMEHHSNIVPWQMLRDERGVVLKVAPIDDRGALDMAAFEKLLGPRTRIVAVVHVSNALGTVNPIAEITALAHRHGAVVVVDGAQAVPHMRVDVRELGCDFYAMSGHKLFGPTGIGVLYGRRELLESMPPYQGGGSMIASVRFEKTVYTKPPARFEAGTPNVTGAVGLGAAIDYVEGIGFERITAYEGRLLAYATERMKEFPGVTPIGTAPRKAGVLSFVIDGVHPHDVGTILDHEGVAIRAGHHCAQPVMERFGVPATARASFAFYNTFDEVDALVAAVRKVIEVFR
jgi:cysteine desulfurase / selenocysteine lyase